MAATCSFGHSDKEKGNSFIAWNQWRNRSARHICRILDNLFLLQIEGILLLSNEFVTSLLL